MKTQPPSLDLLRRLALILALAFGTTLSSFAAPPELDELKQLVKALGDEVIAGKIERMITHTPAPMIAAMGGEEKAKQILNQVMRADVTTLEAAGFKIASFEVGDVESVRTEGEWTFAVVPTTLVAAGEKGKFTARSHTLATRKTGDSKWTLLRLGLPEPKVREFVPQLPPDFKFPEKQPPKFEAQ